MTTDPQILAEILTDLVNERKIGSGMTVEQVVNRYLFNRNKIEELNTGNKVAGMATRNFKSCDFAMAKYVTDIERETIKQTQQYALELNKYYHDCFSFIA